MHSSQNEQDSRFYGDFSLIPMYEPSNQQEAYDMVYNALHSLKNRRTDIIAYGHSSRPLSFRCRAKAQQVQNEISFSEDPRQLSYYQVNARKRYKVLLERQADS